MDTPPDNDSKPAQARRGWFQIHLSTALALMIVAGLLIWLHMDHKNVPKPSFAVGWPFIFYSSNPRSADFRSLEAVFDGVVALLVLMPVVFVFEARHWRWSGGKIFVWVFIGTAISLYIINSLYTFFKSFDQIFGLR